LWHTMQKFSNNCILLVLASDVYKESDYIRDYDEFIHYINIRKAAIDRDTASIYVSASS
jgi:hypothetical protein